MLEYIRVNIALDDILDEEQKQKQNNRRNIDPAEMGKGVPDRPQQRLGNGISCVPDGADEIIMNIDDVKCDEPRKNGDKNDDIAIKLKNEQNNVEKRAHEISGSVLGPKEGIWLEPGGQALD